MNELKHCRSKGQAYFMTLALPPWQSMPPVEPIRDLCMALIRLKQKYRFSIDALVILPRYMQFILTLSESPKPDSSSWKEILIEFTRLTSAPEDASEGLQHGGIAGWGHKRIFGYPLRDDKDFALHMDYLHYNPVNQGLVKKVSEWPYSTFFPYVRQGVYPLSWIRDCASA